MCDSTGGEEGDNGKGKETIHKHFKDWVILHTKFHHDMRMHQDVTVAIAVICQIAIQHNGEDLFEVEYSDQMTEKQAKLKKYWVDFMYTHSKIAL